MKRSDFITNTKPKLFGVYEIGSIFKCKNGTFKLGLEGTSYFSMAKLESNGEWTPHHILNPHNVSDLQGWPSSLQEFNRFYEQI